VELGEPVLGAVVPAAIITSEREVVFLTAPITLNHESSFSVLGIVKTTLI
jgi:hypothetical protein